MHQRDRGNRHTWSVAGSHHLRFKFVCVSAPFAPTQGGILVNSVHLSTYSLSGHDAPKAAASIQDAITGCLRLRRDARLSALTNVSSAIHSLLATDSCRVEF